MEATGDLLYVEQFLNGDRSGFVAIVEKYHEMVFTLSFRILKNREEAEEVAQDVFMSVYKSLNTFHGKSKLSTWIYRIAYNRSLNYLKSQKNYRKTVELNGNVKFMTDHHPDAYEILNRDEKSNQVKKALLRLPETEQIIITLYYYEELSTKEIAEVVGLSVQNVKVKLHRSRQKLYAELKNTVTT